MYVLGLQFVLFLTQTNKSFFLPGIETKQQNADEKSLENTQILG